MFSAFCLAAALSLTPTIGSRPAEEPAPSLALPRIVYAGAAAADLVSTYQSISVGGREQNPLLGWADNDKGKILLAGALTDAGVLYLSTTKWAKKHPRWTKAILYGTAAVRVFLAVQNWNVAHNARSVRTIRY